MAGFDCTRCKKRGVKREMEVYTTRKRENEIIRYRKCPACGYTRKTREV